MAIANNRFYQNRRRIQEISRAQNVDVSTASRMLAKEKGWTDHINELNEWDKECIKYQRDKTLTLADLFARK